MLRRDIPLSWTVFATRDLIAGYPLQVTEIASMKNSELPAGERGVFNVDARLSPTLPSRYYHDPQIHRQELDKIFHKSWCYVGHAG